MNTTKKIALASIAVLTLSFILFFSFRQSILDHYVQKIIRAEKEKHHLDIQIKTIHFSGVSALVVEGLTVVPEDRDTFFHLQQADISVKLFPLLIGKIKLAALHLQNVDLNLVVKDGKRNFDFLLTKSKDTVKSNTGLHFGDLMNKMLSRLLYKVPDELRASNLNLKVRDEGIGFSLQVAAMKIEDKQLSSEIILNQKEAIWHLQGLVNPSQQKLDLTFFADKKKVELPYIFQKFGLKLNFDTVHTVMESMDHSGDQLTIKGSWALRGLLINHPRISPNDVSLDSASIYCSMVFGANDICIDSSSVFYVDKIVGHPFVKYTHAPDKIYELKFHTDKIQANDFFNSLPHGLFNTLQGIDAAGLLDYRISFKLNEREPDSVRFNSELRKEKFKINHFGNVNFQKINGDFIYTPYENGIPMRPILISPANPDFTAFDEISPFLRNAVLTSEDGSFFFHRGFNEEAIKKSIATNFKAKKFKRGASTISMQLVKNIFLNRNKNLSRKVEEMLIVWLIENNYLLSKQRMYEVYLNMIEWGPNVYGIGEASRFYFKKKPSELNLGESLFLASIVPHPKAFRYSCNPDGSLKPFLQGYFNLVSGLMMRKNVASASDTVGFFRDLRIKGSAKNFLITTDSLKITDPIEENILDE